MSMQNQTGFVIDFNFDPSSIELHFVFLENTKSENFDMAINIFNIFLSAFKFGMFSSSLDISVEEYVNAVKLNLDNSQNRTKEYVLKNFNIQDLRIFINLLFQVDFISSQPFSVAIFSPDGASRHKYFLEDIVRFPFQPLPGKTPFNFLFSLDKAISFSPVVRICFQRILIENEVQIVEEAINTWIDFVKKGGYKEELAFSENSYIQDYESYPISPSSWELTLYGFTASEVSFSSLIQFVIRFHKIYCPVVCFEIQP
jgi:hypothetical protein